MKARRNTLKALATSLTLGFALGTPVAQAPDKGTVGVATTTDTSSQAAAAGDPRPKPSSSCHSTPRRAYLLTLGACPTTVSSAT